MYISVDHVVLLTEKRVAVWCMGNSDEEVKIVVMEYLEKQVDGGFNDAGIQKLPERLQKCLDMNGDYVEKLLMSSIIWPCKNFFNKAHFRFFILMEILLLGQAL